MRAPRRIAATRRPETTGALPSKPTLGKLRRAARGSRTVKLRLSATLQDIGRPAETAARTITLR